MINQMGKQIRMMRRKSGLSQEAFARKVGVSFTTINRWENGRSAPNQLAQKMILSMWQEYDLAATVEEGDSPHLKILVVEDDRQVAQSIQQMLRNYYPEFFFELAEDGYEAGVKIATSKPDVVILDFSLSGIRGDQICRKLKTNPATTHVYTIALSSYFHDGLQQDQIEPYADAVLTKPIDTKKLQNQIQIFLDKKVRLVTS